MVLRAAGAVAALRDHERAEQETEDQGDRPQPRAPQQLRRNPVPDAESVGVDHAQDERRDLTTGLPRRRVIPVDGPPQQPREGGPAERGCEDQEEDLHAAGLPCGQAAIAGPLPGEQRESDHQHRHRDLRGILPGPESLLAR